MKHYVLILKKFNRPLARSGLNYNIEVQNCMSQWIIIHVLEEIKTYFQIERWRTNCMLYLQFWASMNWLPDMYFKWLTHKTFFKWLNWRIGFIKIKDWLKIVCFYQLSKKIDLGKYFLKNIYIYSNQFNLLFFIRARIWVFFY